MTQPVCIIVEDQPLIGLSLEAYLKDNGFIVAGPFVTNSDALRWLGNQTPHLALLDVMLKDGASVRIARLLKERRVPFAVYSGLKPERESPPEFRDVPWLEKPMSRSALARTLEQLQGVESHDPV
jgi:DNA-binding NtrC family response regulator